ncbi:hypothetical protein IPJ91_02740 [bacterium]|nr:MAG: hypothetical protein IPJ91_02740 [bacterium]
MLKAIFSFAFLILCFVLSFFFYEKTERFENVLNKENCRYILSRSVNDVKLGINQRILSQNYEDKLFLSLKVDEECEVFFVEIKNKIDTVNEDLVKISEGSTEDGSESFIEAFNLSINDLYYAINAI